MGARPEALQIKWTAREKHVPLVLIRRPQEDGQTMEEILHELGEEEAQCK